MKMKERKEPQITAAMTPPFITNSIQSNTFQEKVS